MIKSKTLATAIFVIVISAPAIYSQDLSKYREFQFGMSLPVTAKQVRLKTSEVRIIHERPAMIQELKWEAWRTTSSSTKSDSVKEINFSFYNGNLFRIVVTYEPDRVDGLTAEDIIEAVSVNYGVAIRPSAEITLPSTLFFSDGEKITSERREKIIARWENLQYSFDLIHSDYPSTFEMVMYTKSLDALARTAVIESIRLDELEAPQRDILRQKKITVANRAKEEKARLQNKPPFRP